MGCERQMEQADALQRRGRGNGVMLHTEEELLTEGSSHR